VSLGKIMSTYKGLPRVDITQLKLLLLKQLGPQKLEKYMFYLKRLLSNKLTKTKFDQLCLTTIGKENLHLHNKLIQSILRNAVTGSGPPPKDTLPGCSGTATKTPSGHFGDALLSPSAKGRSISSKDRKFSPLGPQGMAVNGPAKAPPEVVSVEDGEEVEQTRHSPGVQSRSPIKAPFGIIPNPHPQKPNRLASPSESCSSTGELPSTRNLFMQLTQRCQAEGLSVTHECADLLNRALDAYLKRLIKPSVDLVRAAGHQKVVVGTSAEQSRVCEMRNVTVHDFWVATEMNPNLLGEDWTIKREKLSFASFKKEIENKKIQF
jgi:Transcriptional regulator of RNA polII, SAGA, subunit